MSAAAGEHVLAGRLRRSVLHQFVVPEDDELTWLGEAAVSPAVRRLRAVVAAEEAGGLVVQFALSHLSPPQAPDRPSRWLLRGTIAPWRPHEPRTYPAGRLLVPARRAPGRAPSPLHNLTVELTDDHVTLNMITAIPAHTAASSAAPAPLDVGDLELRTADSDRLVARVPRQAYLGTRYALGGGLVTVPGEIPAHAAADEALCLVSAGSQRSGGAPAREGGQRPGRRRLPLPGASPGAGRRGPRRRGARAVLRARAAARCRRDRGTAVLQPPGPAPRSGRPLSRGTLPRPRHRPAARELGGAGPAPGRACVSWTPTTRAAAGSPCGAPRPAPPGSCCRPAPRTCRATRTCPGPRPSGTTPTTRSATGPAAGYVSVRVLPDDWRLAGTTEDEATFELVYQEVLAYYEHLYSFMKAEVFSLADRCRVETYAKLIWQMCDPRNKAKTYYMPPTRDLSEPKARLLLTFLRARQAPDAVPLTVPVAHRARAGVTTRGRLLHLLREAATLELAVMLQYLYAAYSVPTHGTGLEYVRRGRWTDEQLRLACGDGGRSVDEGIRGTLVTVAREEMIHFLLVNNIITALGEPFHVPRIDFATLNHALPVPLDLCLERLSPGSVERFALIERPDGLGGEARRGGTAPAPEPYDAGRPARRPTPYASLSELYADIREGLERVPDLFLVAKGRGGGEHHLFLRESVNRHHPDYQLEVDDLSSALFAIDIITEQGEGGVLGPRTGAGTESGEESHHASFLRIADLLSGAPGAVHAGGGRWDPAHPVVRNPTLAGEIRPWRPSRTPTPGRSCGCSTARTSWRCSSWPSTSVNARTGACGGPT
ncbi:ferritin-like domain-containing protein [Streptomyces lasalocidi]